MAKPLFASLAISLAGCVGVVGSEPSPTSEPDRDVGSTPDPAGEPGSSGGVPSAAVAEGPAAAAVAPPTSTTLRGCPEGLAVCDDFEDGLDPVWEEVTRGGGSIALEEGALRLDLPPADGARALLVTRPFDSLGESFWGRFHMRTEADVDMIHSFLLNAVGTLDGSRAYYGLHSNQARLNSRYVAAHVEQHGGWKKIGTHRLPEAWTCVELHFDAERGLVAFYFDGEQDPEMRVDETESPPWTGPSLERIEVGFHTYQAAGRSFSVWYDGIAFDSSRVGCE
jgi:hypothetical protein